VVILAVVKYQILAEAAKRARPVFRSRFPRAVIVRDGRHDRREQARHGDGELLPQCPLELSFLLGSVPPGGVADPRGQAKKAAERRLVDLPAVTGGVQGIEDGFYRGSGRAVGRSNAGRAFRRKYRLFTAGVCVVHDRHNRENL
jgi:hypothetical protein